MTKEQQTAERRAEEWAENAPTSELIALVARNQAHGVSGVEGWRLDAAQAELDLRIPRRPK
jgi:hypothetical protein